MSFNDYIEQVKKSPEYIAETHRALREENEWLCNELAEIKERYRWRKQSVEPAPSGIRMEVCEKCGRVETYTSDVGRWLFYPRPSDFWRPLDLPEGVGC